MSSYHNTKAVFLDKATTVWTEMNLQ